MTRAIAVKLLTELRCDEVETVFLDNEEAHIDADEILLAVLDQYGLGEVATAYRQLRGRLPFYYM